MKRRIKINGVIIFIAVLLIVAFPKVFLRKESIAFLDEAAKAFGLAFILMGQILRVSARGIKSEESRNGHALIQGGPYAVCRNPMYLGILLMGLGIVLTLFNWWVTVIFLIVFVTRYLSLICEEEKRLSMAFSKDYQDYCKRVPRFLPSLSTVAGKDISEYLPLKSRWVKKEIWTIVAVLWVIFLAEAWKDIYGVGITAYFYEVILMGIIIILFLGAGIYLNKGTIAKGGDVSAKSKAS